MSFIEWSDNYNTGIPDIDAEHQALFALVNDLYDRVETGSAEASINATIEALIDYVNYHFAREEGLLSSCHYPDLENHKVAHRKLQSQLETCRQSYERHPGTFDMGDFMGFLAYWLQGHILQTDMAYIPCIRRRVGSIVDCI
ncbi:MAG: hemerythrin family protein [Alphaproteobacteria bacterium]|nr:hemerythrin family protein [Alphaproteobacteria bacterium]